MLTTPKFLSVAQIFPLNFRIIYLQIKLVQMEHLISTSNLCSPSPSLSYFGKRPFLYSVAQVKKLKGIYNFALFLTLSIQSAN